MSELEMRNRRARRYKKKIRRRKIVMYERVALLSGALAVAALVVSKWIHKTKEV